MHPSSKQYRQQQQYHQTGETTRTEDTLQSRNTGIDQRDLHCLVQKITIVIAIAIRIAAQLTPSRTDSYTRHPGRLAQLVRALR